jgi:LysR family transcriptional regulator of gallate degradation
MAPQIGTRHLRAFLAVVDHGSASRAAAALLRAQSAITRSVQELERALAVRLFERRAQGMLRTEFGRALERRARVAQAEMSRARREVAACAGPRVRVRNAPVFSLFTPEQRLRAFVALTDQHHMPSVADSLRITQSAVSMAVRSYEESIGVRLFQRTAKGMLPTPAGAALALRIKRALAELRIAAAEIAALSGVTQGTVTVGALPLGRTQLLPGAIAQLLNEHAGLRVVTVEGAFEVLAAGLRAGDLDFILGALRPADYATDLAGEPLLEDELSIVARSGHPWARARKHALRDLAGARWVLPRATAPTRQLLERTLERRGLTAPNVVVETSDLAVLRGVLLHSDVVTAISARQLYYEIEAGMLAVLPMALPETRRSIGVTRRTDSLASPGAQALIDALRRQCRVLLAGGGADTEYATVLA